MNFNSKSDGQVAVGAMTSTVVSIVSHGRESVHGPQSVIDFACEAVQDNDVSQGVDAIGVPCEKRTSVSLSVSISQGVARFTRVGGTSSPAVRRVQSEKRYCDDLLLGIA